MSLDRFTADFNRIFAEHDHKYDCDIQENVESGKRPMAAANRFATLDGNASDTRISAHEGEANV